MRLEELMKNPYDVLGISPSCTNEEVRNAYKENNKAEMIVLAKAVSDLIPMYKETFKKQSRLWNLTNKAFGFEITERRIGGILLRLEVVCEKLSDWASGKLEIIEELEEEVLWYGGKDSEGMLLPAHFVTEILI